MHASNAKYRFLLLPGGQTTQNRFVIPLELHENSTCGIMQNSNFTRLIDEEPMTQRHAFEDLNRTLQDIQRLKDNSNRNKIFGEITVLFLPFLKVWGLMGYKVMEESTHQSRNLTCGVLQIAYGKAPAVANDEQQKETWIEVSIESIFQPWDVSIQQIIDVVYTNFARQ
ncbi:hypothetical protein V2J09_016589 [Rumex salicifolius]